MPNVVDDPQSTQALVGGTPLNASGSQIEAALDREVRQANTLLAEYHDLDFFYGTISSSCRGTVCNTRLGRTSTSDLLEDLTEIDGIPVDYDQEYSPVMTYRGVSIAQARGQLTVPSEPDFSAEAQGLGGWLEYGGFWISGAALYDGPPEEGYLVAYVDQVSVGNSPGTRPSLGTATWEGAMVAADTEFRHAIIGASTVQVDFARMDADVQMSNVWDIDARTRLSSFGWTDLPIDADGTFGDGRTLEASFYGPNHEEAGGIFTTSTLVGAFGAQRQ
ncbi:MAG: hypothetical protein OXF33_11595 [Rhodospirillales bacterium]|nr:hypothetical protein [Rhodospirillales bacterium]